MTTVHLLDKWTHNISNIALHYVHRAIKKTLSFNFVRFLMDSVVLA